jgi:hypothetical protein
MRGNKTDGKQNPTDWAPVDIVGFYSANVSHGRSGPIFSNKSINLISLGTQSSHLYYLP